MTNCLKIDKSLNSVKTARNKSTYATPENLNPKYILIFVNYQNYDNVAKPFKWNFVVAHNKLICFCSAVNLAAADTAANTLKTNKIKDIYRLNTLNCAAGILEMHQKPQCTSAKVVNYNKSKRFLEATVCFGKYPSAESFNLKISA